MALFEELNVGVLRLFGAGGGVSIGLLGGAGTSGNRASTRRANQNFIDFRCETKNTSASSDTRLQYLRLYVNGAGHGMADCSRLFTTVEKAVGSATGQHCSLNYGASGATTGQAIASRNTLHVPNRVLSGGTCAALQAEVYCDGTSSDPGSTKIGLLRFVVEGGNAAAANKIKNLILIDSNQTDGAGQMIYTHTHTPGDAAGSLRVLLNGTPVYLKYWSAE